MDNVTSAVYYSHHLLRIAELVTLLCVRGVKESSSPHVVRSPTLANLYAYRLPRVGHYPVTMHNILPSKTQIKLPTAVNFSSKDLEFRQN